LKKACENVTLKQVEPANCVGYYIFATLYRMDKMQQQARRVMLSEFKTIALMKELKELSCAELIECIKDDDVNVENEDIVIEAVLDWLRHDMDNRKSSFEKILEHVRLPYCRTNYLRNMKYTGDLMNPRCFEYLHEATLFQADTVHHHEMTSCRTLPRTNVRMKSCLLVVGGLTCVQGQNDKVVKDFQYYREDTSCWALLTELPQSVDRLYDVCRVDRGLLLTGGTKSGVAMDKCWLFDLGTKKWQATTPLITARWYHRGVSLED
ncbi:Kelch-like protein 38, partial [Lamellibrachia satsuma]